MLSALKKTSSNNDKLLKVFFILCFVVCFHQHARAGLIHTHPNILKNEPPKWMLEQIQEDLTPFSKEELSSQNLDNIIKIDEARGHPNYLVRYKIINNKVYMSAEFSHNRAQFLLSAFKKLASMTRLPAVDFIVSLHDSLDNSDLPGPIFSFAKNPGLAKQIILMPDFEALLGYQENMKIIERGNAKYPWHSKLNQAIWRGAMTGGFFTPSTFLSFPRSKTVSLSLEFPSIIDAKFTTLSQCEDCEVIKANYPNYFEETLSLEPHLKYKYQLLIDGNTCAYSRAYWQLFSNCVVFKQSSDAIQWYYRALQPYEHYIPVRNDMSDLVEAINWALDNDDEANRISIQAQEFAINNLTHVHVFQYMYQLLLKYSSLQNN